MKKLFLLLAIAAISIPEIQAQCKVLLTSLSGEYSGGCKKGVANGKGKAIGTDTYEGNFKKGLPDGEGTYTWANGDVFTGAFKKGVKVGKGKLIKASGETLDGYWSDDEYIGKNSKPFAFSGKSPSITKVIGKRTSPTGNKIELVFTQLSKPKTNVRFDVNVIEGNYGNKQTLFKNGEINGISIPFRAKVSVKGQSVNLEVYQTGTWVIELDFAKDFNF